MLGGVYTTTIGPKTGKRIRIQLHRFCCLHCSVFLRKCGCGIFRQACWYSLVRSNQRRLCKIFFINVVSMLLLAFSASMKAEVRSYKKRVFVFWCLHVRFHVSVFKVSTLVSVFTSLRFAYAFSSFWCKRAAKTDTKVFVYA